MKRIKEIYNFVVSYFKRCKIPTKQEIKEYYSGPYLAAHRHPLNKLVHFVGNCFILGVLIGLILQGVLLLLPLMLIIAWFGIYIFAWPAHRFIERNKPATFKTNPVLTKICDWIMCSQLILGKLSWDTRRK